MRFQGKCQKRYAVVVIVWIGTQMFCESEKKNFIIISNSGVDRVDFCVCVSLRNHYSIWRLECVHLTSFITNYFSFLTNISSFNFLAINHNNILSTMVDKSVSVPSADQAYQRKQKTLKHLNPACIYCCCYLSSPRIIHGDERKQHYKRWFHYRCHSLKTLLYYKFDAVTQAKENERS